MNESLRLARRIEPGDAVLVAGLPNVWLQVVDASDPALLTLQAPNGACLKVGRLAVTQVHSAREKT